MGISESRPPWGLIFGLGSLTFFGDSAMSKNFFNDIESAYFHPINRKKKYTFFEIMFDLYIRYERNDRKCVYIERKQMEARYDLDWCTIEDFCICMNGYRDGVIQHGDNFEDFFVDFSGVKK